MKAQELYEQLENTKDDKKHLVLAKVFRTVFNRDLKSKEWGFLRRLQKIYGSDTVFWALLSSFHIDSSGQPLKYVTAVCKGMAKEEAERPKSVVKFGFDGLLDYMEDFKRPDWEKILDASSETAQAEVGEGDN